MSDQIKSAHSQFPSTHNFCTCQTPNCLELHKAKVKNGLPTQINDDMMDWIRLSHSDTHGLQNILGFRIGSGSSCLQNKLLLLKVT